MNRNFIFVFILLATLSIVDTIPSKLRKRVTIFGPCEGLPPLDVTEIEPDPFIPGQLGKFHVSGTLMAPIPKGYLLAAGFFDLKTKDIIGSPINPEICAPKGILDCPYPAKTPFSAVLSGDVPAALPPSYQILVAILRTENDPVLACAQSLVTGPPAPASKAPAAPPPSPPPSPPPAAPSSPPPPPPPSQSSPSPASTGGGGGKGSGGIQDSISMLNNLLKK